MLVDVFSTEPYCGNPLAVVLDGDGLSAETMQRFAAWANLSETTFVVAPSDPAADYAVRIFTTVAEMPFAGHPTLGTCAAWLAGGGVPREPGRIVQECGVGLVDIDVGDDGTLAFAAPPLLRDGPVDPALLDEIVAALGLAATDVVDAAWVDNGSGWLGVRLVTAEQVLGLTPGVVPTKVGVIAPHPAGAPAAFEVRAFTRRAGMTLEDPVTGSLNAGLACWMLSTAAATAPYIVAQGTAVGRQGRVHVHRSGDGRVWIGGTATVGVTGSIEL